MSSTVDFFSGLFLIVFSVAAHLLADRLPDAARGLGPGDYPKVVLKGILVLGTILAATSVYHLIKNRQKEREKPVEKKFEKGEFQQVFLLIVCVVLYIYLVRFFGFIYLTPPFMFIMMLIFGLRKWIRMIVISLLTTAITYLLFNNFLLVILPRFNLF